MKIMNGLRLKKLALALAVPAVLMLAGCQGTLHTRWVEKTDSYNHWAPLMSTMAVDVHGVIPGTTQEQTVARVPHGTTGSDYQANNPSAVALNAHQRIVLYIGGNQVPVNGDYCTSASTMRGVKVPQDKVMIASALCDGPRLVVASRRGVSPANLSSEEMGSTLQSIKDHLLFGLEVSHAQQPTEQDDGDLPLL